MAAIIYFTAAVLFILTVSLAVFLTVMLIRQQVKRLIAAAHFNVIHGMADGVIVIDQHGNVVEVNNSAARFVEITAQNLKGKPIRTVFTVLRDLPPHTREYSFSWTARNGADVRWYDARYSLLKPDRPLTSPSVIVIRDVTERVQTSRRELEISRNNSRAAMLHEFVTNISHDLFTPLSSIKLSDYLLQRMLDNLVLPNGSTEAIRMMRERLSLIELQTMQIERILRDMIDMVKLDSRDDFALHVHNLNSLVDHSVTPFRSIAAEKQQQIVIAQSPDMPPVIADRDRVERVIQIMLQNAIDYSLTGARISVKTCLYRDCATIEVEDHGLGIAKQDLPHIFEPFFRGDSARASEGHGSGLSLAIARKIVTHHGGSIEVESEEGKGTIIRVLLPVAQAEALARGQASHHALTLPRAPDAWMRSRIELVTRPSIEKPRRDLASSS